MQPTEQLTEQLTQVIYVSQWNGRPLMPAIDALIEQSARDNRKRDVSGILLIHGRALMQLLEGDAAVVDELVEKVSRDPRHSEMDILLRKAVAKRLYPEWGMGVMNLSTPLVIDRDRMRHMIDDIQSTADTRKFSVESRILLRDFEEQARLAA